MSNYLSEFYQKIKSAESKELIPLYGGFLLPEEIQNDIRNRTLDAFNQLWNDPDFRLYLFYRCKTGKNINGALDWLVSKVWQSMGQTGLKMPNIFQHNDNVVAYYNANLIGSQTLNLSKYAAESRVSDLLNTIFHELTHELQDVVAQTSDDVWGQVLRFNKRSYIASKTDRKAYLNQPVEAEAWLSGSIAEGLVLQKENSETFAKETIEYPVNDFAKGKDAYSMMLNPYQCYDIATNITLPRNKSLTDEKKWRLRKQENINSLNLNVNLLGKCIDFGRFVNNGDVARDAINELQEIAHNPMFVKYYPGIKDRVLKVLDEYKSDKKLSQLIAFTRARINMKKMYSAPENVSGRVAVYMNARDKNNV